MIACGQDFSLPGTQEVIAFWQAPHFAGVAQLVEQLPCKHQVGRSTRPTGSTLEKSDV